MTKQQKHSKTSGRVDEFLLEGDLKHVAMNEKYEYEEWYAVLLSAVALLVADEEVKYAYADYEPSMPDVRISVFTTNLVVFAEIDMTADGVPVARAIARRSLIAMTLSASERINAQDRQSYEWPGIVNLKLSYPDLQKTIEIVANGINPYAVHEPSELVTFIESLSADLANRSSIES